MAEEELRPQHETLQARDKVVLKMTRDGAAEENLTQGSTERISHRPEDAVFQSEENASASEETPASQKPHSNSSITVRHPRLPLRNLLPHRLRQFHSDRLQRKVL